MKKEELVDLLNSQPHAALLHSIGASAAQLGIDAFAVGGAVRDILLGRKTTDIDFMTVGPATGIKLAEAVGAKLGGETVHVYPNFGTAAIRLGGDKETVALEFVAARKESYRKSSRKPIVEDGTLEEDLRRRDFTVNALALPLNPDRFGEIIDLFEGRKDLLEERLRTPLDPARTFEDDPLRMIRAARFAAQLGFQIAPGAFTAMKEQAGRVDILSQERITEELQKIMVAPLPSIGFKALMSTGILPRIFPELTALHGVDERDGERHKDNFYHTLEVLDNLSTMTADRSAESTRWLRWAALLHDIAKPRTKRFSRKHGWTFHGHEHLGSRLVPDLFRRLKLPGDERMKYVQKLVLLHHRPVSLVDEDVTDSAVRRLLYDAGDDVDDLMTLVRADITSKNPRRVRRYLAAFDRVEKKMTAVEEKDRLRQFQPPVDGYEIMETLGVEEGVAIGIIKENIREAILEGEIPNEHDAAYAYMMAMKDEAMRRGELFEEIVSDMEGRERQAIGAVKEEIFRGEVPKDHDAAVAHLDRIKERALAQEA